MIVIGQLDYAADNRIKKELTQEQYERLAAQLSQIKWEPWENREKQHVTWHEIMIDLDTDGVLLTELELPFTIKRMKGCRLDAIPGSPGARVLNVHVSNVGLFSVNEVFLMENACTDELQTELNKGWMIIAVCPPNDQRRPDYILGRFNPDKDIEGRARRR